MAHLQSEFPLYLVVGVKPGTTSASSAGGAPAPNRYTIFVGKVGGMVATGARDDNIVNPRT